MVERGVARKVPREELENYEGIVNYLPHLVAFNPKSKSTPVRVVFDTSREQKGRPSLNQLWAKGPDCYINNLVAVIIRFCDGRYAAIGDIRKMFNTVKLVETYILIALGKPNVTKTLSWLK